MNRYLILPAVALLAACENGVAIPDFRGSGGDDRGTFTPEATASAPVAEAAPLVAKERLVAATEANGCVINITTIATIMQQAAVGNDELPGLVTELENEGRIAPEGTDGLRLTTPTCTA